MTVHINTIGNVYILQHLRTSLGTVAAGTWLLRIDAMSGVKPTLSSLLSAPTSCSDTRQKYGYALWIIHVSFYLFYGFVYLTIVVIRVPEREKKKTTFFVASVQTEARTYCVQKSCVPVSSLNQWKLKSQDGPAHVFTTFKISANRNICFSFGKSAPPSCENQTVKTPTCRQTSYFV